MVVEKFGAPISVRPHSVVIELREKFIAPRKPVDKCKFAPLASAQRDIIRSIRIEVAIPLGKCVSLAADRFAFVGTTKRASVEEHVQLGLSRHSRSLFYVSFSRGIWRVAAAQPTSLEEGGAQDVDDAVGGVAIPELDGRWRFRAALQQFARGRGKRLDTDEPVRAFRHRDWSLGVRA